MSEGIAGNVVLITGIGAEVARRLTARSAPVAVLTRHCLRHRAA